MVVRWRSKGGLLPRPPLRPRSERLADSPTRPAASANIGMGSPSSDGRFCNFQYLVPHWFCLSVRIPLPKWEASDRLREAGISEAFGGVLWGGKPLMEGVIVKIGRILRIGSNHHILYMVCVHDRSIP